ncbi:hypothetical protein HKT27_35070, partial [Pseudomonas aeruginosa]|nr:hypothetical protein [Pseudomonas aeruginosa]
LDDIPEPVPAWRLPRALAAAFFVFCALLVATLFWRDQSLGPNLAYGTAPGEQREVVLRTDRSCSSTSIPRCRCVTPSAPATCC